MVAKAANPDTKFDWVLDLVGGQGVGKTTLLMKLAPPGTYTDQFLSFTDKDDFAAMRNALIVNDDEMTVSNRTSFEEIKKFITMKEFTYRPPYARSNETFKKNSFCSGQPTKFATSKINPVTGGSCRLCVTENSRKCIQ